MVSRWLSRLLHRSKGTNHPITITTDFGGSHYQGILEGVVYSINPQARLVTLSHRVRPQDVREAAFVMKTAVPYHPYGVHLGVVFPTVGTPGSRSIAIRCRRGVLVGPDNGILMPAARELGLDAVYEVSSPLRWLTTPSNAFSAVEVYGSLAAYLSMGLNPRKLGPRIYGYVEWKEPEYRASEEGLEGEVLTIDHFGNILTSIPGREVARFAHYNDLVEVEMDGKSVKLPLLKSYGYAPRGSVLVKLNRTGMLEIAANCDNASRLLKVEAPCRIRVLPVPSDAAEAQADS